MKISVDAYAKINLFLDIESLREDGYHNISSLMQTVSLHDTLTIEYDSTKEKNIEITCDNLSVPCDRRNLAYRAAEIFPISMGQIKIKIEKRIPMSAGLAGGSADAAAVLIALNSVATSPMSNDELKTLGNKLGADVPFCIERGSCIASGTGDILQKAPPMPYYPIIIAKKGEGMSTPEAYRALDTKYNNFDGYVPKIDKLDILISNTSSRSINDYSKGLFNIFESVVEPCRPFVSEIKNIMLSNGAVCSMMSGSGTSVFGIFNTENDAKIALSVLISSGIDAHLCYPI